MPIDWLKCSENYYFMEHFSLNWYPYIMNKTVSIIVKAKRKDCFEASSYENISLWSKMFSNGKVLEKNGNVVKYSADARIMWFTLHPVVTGIIKPYEEVVETIDLGDGSITKETMKYFDVPGGTRIEWSGHIAKSGKYLKWFGPILKIAFPLSVGHDLKNLAKFIESGEYKRHSSDLFDMNE